MGETARFEQVCASARRHSLGRRAARPALIADTGGATAIEYAVMAGLIALVLISALTLLSGGNGGMWANVEAEVTSALSGEGS
ncbi:Flp family type IVb pilin [Glycocaulis sp.]|uniref:Flp family type IVb pilin n=1 Tax=Glycocaulis sp. TaxID=1969725 RepID=UPI003D1E3E45